jgi:hypothetical protein
MTSGAAWLDSKRPAGSQAGNKPLGFQGSKPRRSMMQRHWWSGPPSSALAVTKRPWGPMAALGSFHDPSNHPGSSMEWKKRAWLIKALGNHLPEARPSSLSIFKLSFTSALSVVLFFPQSSIHSFCLSVLSIVTFSSFASILCLLAPLS